MKKTVSILLISLLTLFLVACGGSPSERPTSSNHDVENSTFSDRSTDKTDGSGESSSSATSTDESGNSDEQQDGTVTDTNESACSHEFSAATCEAPQTCKKCGETTGKALGHSFGEWVTEKDATCTSNGSQTRSCKCGHSEKETIRATGHKYKDATCSEPKTCTMCNTTVGAALGHKFLENACTSCGFGYRKIISYIDDYNWIDSQIDVIRDDGAVDYGFMVKVAKWYLPNRDQYLDKDSWMYKVPEAIFIEEIRKYCVLPEDQVSALKESSPYCGDVEYKNGFFYIVAGGYGAEGPSSGFDHVFMSYVKKSGVIELYFDYQSYSRDEETFEKIDKKHISYYKMTYTYAGSAEFQISSSQIESYDKEFLQSLRLVSVHDVDAIPNNAIPVK